MPFLNVDFSEDDTSILIGIHFNLILDGIYLDTGWHVLYAKPLPEMMIA